MAKLGVLAIARDSHLVSFFTRRLVPPVLELGAKVRVGDVSGSYGMSDIMEHF